jgi:PKD repeat protein/flagellar hook assembly protein FlgD
MAVRIVRLGLAQVLFSLAAIGSASAAISVSTPTAAPAAIEPVATEIVVTSQLSWGPGDPAVLPNGVNLLRLDRGPQGIVLGVMRDDGLGSDAVAGDGLYTLKISLNEPLGVQVQLQVSAAFRGLLQRSRSGVTTIPVADTTPPLVTISPGDGTTVSTITPSVQVAYSDTGAGADPATLAITIDAIDFTSRFTVAGSSATGQLTLSGGLHVISASIKDRAGNTGQAVAQFNIFAFQSLPRATPVVGTIPLRVTFISDAIYTAGALTRWRWDYEGDGAFDVDEIGARNHTRTFTQPGIYRAVLEVTNDLGQVTTATVTVTATNPPPTATARVTPSNGPPPLAVTLTGTGTSPNGTIVRYEWDRLGTGTFDFSSTTTGTTTFTYAEAGTYNTVFRVTDSLGQTATAVATSTAVRIGPPGSPSARITAPSGPLTGSASLFVTFNGTGTPTSGRTITKYEWDFNGDGTFDTSSTTSAGATFTYSSPGVFAAAFRVTDSAGDTAYDVVDIKVNMSASLTVSTDTLRPASGGTVNIRTSIGGTVPVTILLKNRAGQAVRTLVNDVTRTGRSYTDVWDGKGDSGEVVPEGVYYAVLQYKVGSTTIAVDQTDTTGNDLFQPDRTLAMTNDGAPCPIITAGAPSKCVVNPLTNNFLRADFTLFQAAEVSISIREYYTGQEVVPLFERRPFGRNMAYSAFWDGTDATGKVLRTAANGSYVYGMTAFTLPDNAIFVENAPQLTGVTASPNYFDPATGDFISPANPTTKISYTLSKPATLSLQVFRSGTNALLRTVTQSAGAGPGVIEWDGHAGNGLFADTGDYHLALKAFDAAGSQSLVRYVVVRVYY